MSAIPALTLEVAFATNPGATPVWTALPDRLRGFSISRGRNQELALFQAGQLSLLLDNRDRALDPTNTASPYFPNVLPMRRVRLSVVHESVTYRLFSGYVEGWPQSWPGMIDAVVSVAAVDGFKVLALAGVGGTFPEQRTDERIAALLDDVDWPAADRDLEVGQTDIQEVLLAQSSALSNIQKAEEVEQGRFFMTPAGVARFLDRHTPLLQTSPVATFGDGGGDELPYVDLVPVFDDANLWNRIRILRTGAVESQQAEDTASQVRYYQRTLRNEDVLYVSDADALSAAQALLHRYAEPRLRFEGITVLPQADPRLWPVVLSLDLGDMVDVVRRPPGGGDPIEQRSLVEAVRHQWSVVDNLWATTYQLSSMEAQAFWLLEIPGASELGETTVLGW